MALLSFALALTLVGQASTGRLHGHVFDPSGAVLIGAPVVMTSPSGRVVDTKTDRQGSYAIDRLSPGEYVVTATAAGFADQQVSVTIAAAVDQALDITLPIATQRQQVLIQAHAAGATTAPGSNASAIVIRGADLDALSDDPNELEAQLHTLAGFAPGGGGGQIYIDGFTGGRLPPKSAIQEIRINQNPYSAEFDTLGTGRVEIITKPGSETLHGRFLLDGNTSALDARNPFSSQMPPHHSSLLSGTFGGPLGPKASFLLAGEWQNSHETAAVSAVTLDSNLNQAALRQTADAPQSLAVINPRVDVQPARNNTLSIRYQFHDDNEHGLGVGGLSLPSQALDVRKIEHVAQASDLQIIGPTLLNDLRVEYRTFSVAQEARALTPQISVLGAFVGGGSSLGSTRTSQRHIEVHDYVSAALGAHVVRLGGRLRATTTSDRSGQNVNGTFTFASLDAYRTTERGVQQGWTADQIRSAGGGASQFSIVAGEPIVSDTLVDIGLFVQDEWRLRPNLTTTGGLRVETQNDIALRASLAPRVSVAWNPGRSSRRGSSPWVVRAGAGLFYDRFPQSLVLQARRLDNDYTRQFVVAAPDFFPLVPTVAALAASQVAATVSRIDPDLVVPRTTQVGVSMERRIGGSSTVSVGYLLSHGVRQLLSRNINAPTDAGRASLAPAYEVESAGIFSQHQLTANAVLRPTPWLSFNGSFVLSSARGNSSGAGSFPSNPFDLSADYGRTAFDVRRRLLVFAGIDLPGFRVVPFITATSGQPFDITIGQDLNKDSIFNDRPAFATDRSRPSVVVTRFGVFDTAPTPGQTIIPRNFGIGPAQLSVNLRVMKPFVVKQHDTIRFDLVVSNLLNRVNAATPVGSLSSPIFGQSTGLAGAASSSSNRRIQIQLQFLF